LDLTEPTPIVAMSGATSKAEQKDELNQFSLHGKRNTDALVNKYMKPETERDKVDAALTGKDEQVEQSSKTVGQKGKKGKKGKKSTV
jgi:hypothetical protein